MDEHPIQVTEIQAPPKIETDYTLLPEVVEDWVYRKAVQAVHSYPLDAEMSVIARRVMNALCVHAQRLFAQMSDLKKDQIKDPKIRATPIFRIRVATIREITEQNGNDNTRIYQAIDNLMSWTFHFNVMEDKTGEAKVVERVKAHFLSQVGIGERDGLPNGEITYEIPNAVLLMILEPFPYAQIDMHCINSLKRSYAIALYENCVRYMGSETKHTATLPIAEWTNLIAGPDKYVGQYPDFRRYCLRPAMEELASLASVPFTLRLIEKKGPRNKVLGIQFELILKRQKAFNFTTPPPVWPKTLVDVLANVYKMSMQEMGELSQIATEDELNEAMRRYKLAEEKKFAAGETISKKADYLRSILINMQGGRQKIKIEAPVEDLEAKALEEAKGRAQKIRDEFAQFQKTVIAAKIDAMNEFDLQELRQAFSDSHQDFAMQRMITSGKGWSGSALKLQLVNWVKSKPELADRFLLRPHELDINIWRELDMGKQQ